MDAPALTLAGTIVSAGFSLVLGYATARWKHRDTRAAVEPQWFGAVLQGWEKELARLHARVIELEAENERLRVEIDRIRHHEP